jgi:hypothetical protein
MSAVLEYVKSCWAQKETPKTNSVISNTSVYDERIECFKKLAHLQKQIKYADEQFVTVSLIEGKTHENAQNCMEVYTKEYRKEYELCEKIMKY